MFAEMLKSQAAQGESGKTGDISANTRPPVSENGMISSATDFQAEVLRFKSMLGVN